MVVLVLVLVLVLGGCLLFLCCFSWKVGGCLFVRLFVRFFLPLFVCRFVLLVVAKLASLGRCRRLACVCKLCYLCIIGKGWSACIFGEFFGETLVCLHRRKTLIRVWILLSYNRFAEENLGMFALFEELWDVCVVRKPLLRLHLPETLVRLHLKDFFLPLHLWETSWCPSHDLSCLVRKMISWLLSTLGVLMWANSNFKSIGLMPWEVQTSCIQNGVGNCHNGNKG